MLFLAILAAAVGAAAPKIAWAPKSDRGFDQAMEQRRFVLQLFVKPKCPECALLERTALQDPDVVSLIGDRFVAIRSDLSRPDGKSDAENYGVETFPTLLFFNARGEQIDGASLVGPVGGSDLLQHLVNITSGKFGQETVKGQISTTGQAVVGASPSGTSWSKPDTASKIAPPPLPDTAAPATP